MSHQSTEVTAMLPTTIELDQAHERHEDFAAEAGRVRTASNAPAAASTSRTSIRRAIGRRFIALGRRIAAEPGLELVRSR